MIPLVHEVNDDHLNVFCGNSGYFGKYSNETKFIYAIERGSPYRWKIILNEIKFSMFFQPIEITLFMANIKKIYTICHWQLRSFNYFSEFQLQVYGLCTQRKTSQSVFFKNSCPKYNILFTLRYYYLTTHYELETCVS